MGGLTLDGRTWDEMPVAANSQIPALASGRMTGKEEGPAVREHPDPVAVTYTGGNDDG